MPRPAFSVAARVSLPLALLGLPAACGPGSDAAGTESDTSGSTGEGTTDGAPSTSMPAATTSEPATSDDTTSTTAPVDAESSTGGSSEEGGFIPRPDGGGKGDLLLLGEMCEADADCASGSCFMFGDIGFGLCSECAHDSDCMMDGPGTCSLTMGSWATCTGGEPGTMCESDEGCAGDQVCAPLFEGNPFDFCSQCATDAECDDGQGCAPTLTVGNACVSPGTVENGGFCPDAGDAYCISTHCTEALYDDTPVGIWVCGECTTDTDCPKGETCMPAVLTDMEIGASACG